ncbi:MAG TPA: hypothetical protein VN823_14255 [Stellaceae bacterium]|nr:hypothetical protein [Stellaceae bacterium]
MSRKSTRSKADPRFYQCPNCEKGTVRWVGRDLRKQDVYQCDECGRKVGHSGLESAASRRWLED